MRLFAIILFLLTSCLNAGAQSSNAFDSWKGDSLARTDEDSPGHLRRMLSTSPPTCDDGRLDPPPLAGKKGVGLTLREPGDSKGGTWDVNIPKVLALNVSWNYSWNNKRAPNQPDHIEYIPMIWSAKNPTKLAETLRDIVIPQFEAGLARRLLGYNEPDKAAQADMTVDQAVTAWYQLQNTSMPLASPSPAKRVGSWMDEFMNRTEEECLRMEYLGVHWYSGPSFKNFKNAMNQVFTEYGGTRPLIITEFAVADWKSSDTSPNRHSKETVLAFMKQALPWLEATPWVAGYAWFPFEETREQGRTSALFDLNHTITPLGEYYASVTPDNPSGDQSISY